MTGYALSPQVKALEKRWAQSRETKSIIGLGALADHYGSRQDGTNFRTNMVTLAQYADAPRGNALGLSAVYGCINLLCGTIGSLPLMVYRTDANGQRALAKDHPLYYVLHDSPNFDQTAVDFWEFMCAGVELHGNAYAVISFRGGNTVFSLIPIRPDIVEVKRNGAGQLEYSWVEDGKQKKRGQADILHIRGFGGNPLGGASTLSACRQTFSAALSAEQAARNMFDNGARPSGVLSTDKTLTAEQRKIAEDLLAEKFMGAMNAGRPMLLDNAVKWEQLTISPEDAQMLETRRFSVEEICRVFGVPPHMIGHTENSTSWGTGLEQQTLGFQKFTLRRRLKRIEQALEKQLLTPGDRNQGVTIEFNLDGLLRGDSMGRASVNEIYLRNKVLTVNEVRAQDNLPPVAWGYAPWVQQQDTQVGSVDDAAQ